MGQRDVTGRKNKQKVTDRTGLLDSWSGRDCRNRIARTRQAGRDSHDSRDKQNRTGKVGYAERDTQKGRDRTRQTK